MNKNPAERMELELQEIKGEIARWTENHSDPPTAVEGLSIFRLIKPVEAVVGMHEPSVCIIAQGSKKVMLGEDVFMYDPHHYLLTSVHVPTIVKVLEASEEKPYMGLTLTLDLREVSQMMVDSNLPAPRTQKSSRGMATGEMTPALLDAFKRLVGLLDDEESIPILAPTIQREILYRLLVGDQGARLRQIAATGSQSQQIARAIEWLKENYLEPLHVEELASRTGMSISTFHHHFRTMTASSPLQYQKRLRLQEARRLMLMERIDAASAAFHVGYESPSQFSREYSRLFGAPPVKDISSMRQAGYPS